MKDINLISYVKEARQIGLNREEIFSNLTNAGWTQEQINEVYYPQVPTPGKLTVNLGSLSMWDAFEHILMFISMYSFITALVLSLLNFIDRWLPNAQSTYQAYYLNEPLKGFLSALLVSYPLFTYLFLRITKKTAKFPQIRALPSRKLLIYMTLIIAFLILVGDLITVLFRLLDGSLFLNFALKASVFGVLGLIVFTYYFYQVREDRKAFEGKE